LEVSEAAVLLPDMQETREHMMARSKKKERAEDKQVKMLVKFLHKTLTKYAIGSKKYNILIKQLEDLGQGSA
jgi:hypothetical protein